MTAHWVGYVLLFGTLFSVVFFAKLFIDKSISETPSYCDLCGAEMEESYDQGRAILIRAGTSEFNKSQNGSFDYAVQKCNSCKKRGR